MTEKQQDKRIFAALKLGGCLPLMANCSNYRQSEPYNLTWKEVVRF